MPGSGGARPATCGGVLPVDEGRDLPEGTAETPGMPLSGAFDGGYAMLSERRNGSESEAGRGIGLTSRTWKGAALPGSPCDSSTCCINCQVCSFSRDGTEKAQKGQLGRLPSWEGRGSRAMTAACIYNSLPPSTQCCRQSDAGAYIGPSRKHGLQRKVRTRVTQNLRRASPSERIQRETREAKVMVRSMDMGNESVISSIKTLWC